MVQPAVCANHQDTRDMIIRVEDRVDDHEIRIDNLERKEVSADERIKALCEKIDGLISVIKWAVGITATVLIGAIPVAIWIMEKMR